MKSFIQRGMTLVELMVVVAIVALLMGVMAYFVLGNRDNNAQVDLSNEVIGLLQAQRTRAMSMNVATYVRFNYSGGYTIVAPRIGLNSICTADLAGQLPIMYTDVAPVAGAADSVDNIVAIDIVNRGSGNRTLDSKSTNKYVASDGSSLASISILHQTLEDNESGSGKVLKLTKVTSDVFICFQPNGQAQFIENGTLMMNVLMERIFFGTAGASVDASQAVTGNKSGGVYYVDVTGLGLIQTATK